MDGKQMGLMLKEMFKTIYPDSEVNGIFTGGNAGAAIMGFQLGASINRHADAVSELAHSMRHLADSLKEAAQDRPLHNTQLPAAQNAADLNNGLGGTSGEPATKKDNGRVAGA